MLHVTVYNMDDGNCFIGYVSHGSGVVRQRLTGDTNARAASMRRTDASFSFMPLVKQRAGHSYRELVGSSNICTWVNA